MILPRLFFLFPFFGTFFFLPSGWGPPTGPLFTCPLDWLQFPPLFPGFFFSPIERRPVPWYLPRGNLVPADLMALYGPLSAVCTSFLRLCTMPFPWCVFPAQGTLSFLDPTLLEDFFFMVLKFTGLSDTTLLNRSVPLWFPHLLSQHHPKRYLITGEMISLLLFSEFTSSSSPQSAPFFPKTARTLFMVLCS